MNATRTNRVARFQVGSLASLTRPARGHAPVIPRDGRSVYALEMNGVLAIDGGRVVRLVCDHGQVWVTQAGDERDVILSPGASFTSAGTGKIVVQALVPSRILVTPA